MEWYVSDDERVYLCGLARKQAKYATLPMMA